MSEMRAKRAVGEEGGRRRGEKRGREKEGGGREKGRREEREGEEKRGETRREGERRDSTYILSKKFGNNHLLSWLPVSLLSSISSSLCHCWFTSASCCSTFPAVAPES